MIGSVESTVQLGNAYIDFITRGIALDLSLSTVFIVVSLSAFMIIALAVSVADICAVLSGYKKAQTAPIVYIGREILVITFAIYILQWVAIILIDETGLGRIPISGLSPLHTGTLAIATSLISVSLRMFTSILRHGTWRV
jgi:hypothetical protein